MFPNDIPKQLIDARSKSDWLGKGLICFQVVWMLTQIIARKVAGLPVTLLELNTAVHIGCAILLYFIWWYKPQDVRVLVVVDISGCEKCKSTLMAEDFVSKGLVSEVPNTVGDKKLGVDGLGLTTTSVVILLIALNATYGGIHTAAWNAHFPSLQEQILWRVSACIVIGAGVIVWGCALFSHSFRKLPVLPIIFLIPMVLFAFGRLYLVVEAFISVRSLPVGAYNTTDWVNFLPHIG